MPVALMFTSHLILGYVASALAFFVYILPKFRTMGRFEVQRAIATLHSFRFFGLVFLIPGVVGVNLPHTFAAVAAWGDFATGILALLALLTQRVRPLFWLFVVAFNLAGVADILIDYMNAVQGGLPGHAGELGAAYVIPIIYVPMLMITHFTALWWLVRPAPAAARMKPA